MKIHVTKLVHNLRYSLGFKRMSRLGAAVALSLATTACAGEDPQGDARTETEGVESSGGEGAQNNNEDGEQEDNPNEASTGCSDIKWGSSLKIGGIIPKSQARGYLDTDGDHQADEKEQEVGMCQLHQLKAKCGLIMTGWYGCIGCGPEFESLNGRMKELRDAKIAVYAIYSEMKLTSGLKLMNKYFGSAPDMYSNSSELTLEFAPMKILVNLKNMEIIQLDRTENGNPVVFEIQDAIDACNEL